MSASADIALLAELSRRLEADAARIAERVTETLHNEVDDYTALSVDELRRGIRGFVAGLASGFRTSEADRLSALVAANRAGARRCEQGIPLEFQLRAVRLTANVMLERGREHLAEMGTVGEAGGLETVATALEWLDEFSNAVTKGYRDTAARLERSRAYSISAFLHSLLAGQLESARLEAEAAAIGLEPRGSEFRAVRVRPSDRTPAHRLRELIADASGQSSLVGIVGGDVVGVVQAPPRLPPGITGGIGPAGPLQLVNVSFARASVALSAALTYGLEGLHSAAELALQAAVLDDHVGGALEHRVLVGLAGLGERGGVLADTAREFLACDASLTATAASLHLHVNTLRHRLARFEDATGIDLRRTEDLVAAWIALERLRVMSS